MKRIIIIALALMALTSFGSQQTQEAEARVRHIVEVQRARAERIKREIDRAGRMNSENMQAYYESLYDRIEEKKHNLSQSLEEYRARRKARLAAKEAAKNKLLVKKLTKESAGLMRKNEQLRKELDKTINELAEYRSQVKHLSSQLRSLPKSLGRGASSGPARRRK